MNPSELTADLVRKELESIIERYPSNTGMVDNIEYYEDSDEAINDPTCVYFKDDKGIMVTPAVFGHVEENVVLATPVCIVGMWIEEFHPEFKDDAVIRNILVRNVTIQSFDYSDLRPWNEDVHRLLVVAQRTQDRGCGSWSDIDLDKHPSEL
jgi:hypothetical protein